MNLALSEIELPLRLRFEHAITDEQLLRFSADNDALRMERDANGELIVMSPAGGGGGQRNSQVTFQIVRWAEETNSGATFDSSTGFHLPDGSVRSPDAAWIS